MGKGRPRSVGEEKKDCSESVGEEKEEYSAHGVGSRRARSNLGANKYTYSKMVFSGLRAAWFLAASPTRRSSPDVVWDVCGVGFGVHVLALVSPTSFSSVAYPALI